MEGPAQHPWTLRFRPDELEDAFRKDYVRNSLRQVRYALLLGIAIYGFVFGAMDLLTAPEQVGTVWPIRAVVCALTLGAYAFTFSPLFRHYMQPVLSVLLVAGGWGLVLMLALDPSGEYYFEGPVLMIVPAFVCVRLRFVYATAVGWLIVAAYVVVAIGVKDSPTTDLASDIIFISAATIIGMFAGYMLEYYARLQFWQAQVIDEKRRENEELLQARSRFFANVSHEFRTPLTLILGPLDNMLDEKETSFSQPMRRRMEIMQRNGRRLLRLINQLLNLARLEAGGLHLHAREQPLLPFLRRTIQSFDDFAGRKGIDLSLQTDEKDLLLYFDQDKLEKVIINLLGNALKFTPQDGSVRVAVALKEQFAEIRVRDTGPGIPPSDLPYIFDRFRQGDDSSLRERSGSGIGLALTKELVELHHGTIEATSEEGFGSEFVVTLPLGRAHLREEDILEDEEREAPPSDEEVFAYETDGVDQNEKPVDDSPRESARPTLLVVEDDIDVRAYVRDCLGDSYDIIEAEDGESGLEKARAAVPDLVITDVMMPGMDGYAFCRTVKADRVLDHIPVLMLTAKTKTDHTIEGLEAGADAYLGKPFKARELQARVQNLLENRRRLRQRFADKVLVQSSPVDVESADEQFIRNAREVVEENIADEQFNIDAFAEAVGMSRRQLERKLRAVADHTPNTFIRDIRLSRGAQLIEQEYGAVSEIAYAVGFSSPAYFTKCFREVYGVPPSEYTVD